MCRMKKARQFSIDLNGEPKKARKTAKRKDASGTFMGIPIADPAVRPKGVTVRQIRKAVADARKRA